MSEEQNRFKIKYRIENEEGIQHLILDSYFMNAIVSTIDCGTIEEIITKIKLYDEEYNNLLKQNEYMKQIQNNYKDLQDRRNKAIDKLSFIDEALENDTLNVPLCIAKINKTLEILGDNNEC